MSGAKNWFLQAAGVCAFLGPIVMVAADSINIFGGQAFIASIVLWLAFVLIVPGLIGFTYLLTANGSKLAFVGGVLAYLGAMAGAAMQVLFRVYAVLGETDSTAAIDQLRGTFKLIAATQMIGLPFPIGLLLLAISYYRNGSAGFIHPVLLAIGAVLFPIGRIGLQEWAILASGVLIMIVFMTIGRKLMAEANA
jgi:hypothetical protein